MARRRRVVALVMLLLFVMFIIYGSAPAHGHIQDAEGCYCHNGGVSVRKNGEDWNSAYSDNTLKIQPGGSMDLHFNTTNIEAQGADPCQEWKSNIGDNSKFTLTPQIVYDNSLEDQCGINGTIAVMYTITAPETLQNGWYEIALIAQGAYLAIWVSVEGTPIPEFDNEMLILTFSVFAIVAVFGVMRSRKRLPKNTQSKIAS